ncbi:MAG: iron hydrogenase small subunit [Clostridia bacterium]|nr:iron hydrogenase small subunit [Clostridia bacterium]
MVNLKIDNISVTVPEGTTILDAARQAGINIPTLCYFKGLNEIGACRVCVVEIKGESRLVAACDNVVSEGLEIFTNSPKVRQARRTNVELILSQHSSRCPSCVRSGNCSLQQVANDLGITSEPYEVNASDKCWNDDFPLIRDASKCIRCMRCIQVCEKIQGLGIWDLNGTGSRTDVGVAGGKKIENTACVLCGQCITHCPVGALHERDDTQKAFAALADPEITTVIQIAPAVRAAWGEGLGLDRDAATVKRLVAGLRKVGFDYIFDTDFSADLTIMEEGSEFLERLKAGDIAKYPMFTSCCPGWVRFMKSQYPDMLDRLSSAKSPQAMFGAVTKTYFAEKIGVAPEKVFCISIMPCVSKKQEIEIPNINDSGTKDVDLVLTTREVDRIFRAEHIDVAALEEEEFDSPLGDGTGAAVIFGTTGGVMEAALRSAYFLVTGSNPDPDHFKAVRGFDGPWREAEFELAGSTLRVAIASGLANTRKLIEAIRAGKVYYDFVEIMACPGGCGGGGGQPICDGFELAQVRDEKLYALDRESKLRFSHENPSVQALYTEFLGQPLSEKAHHLLHTDHHGWKMPCEEQ